MRDGVIVAEGKPEEIGGRDVMPTEIRFVLPPDRAAADLPELPGVEVTREEDWMVLRTHEVVPVTARITAWALEQKIELGHFSVTQPSLEDIYLALTGSDQDGGAAVAEQ
jgi:ABC-2 type transport system ATP-binding protein